MLKENSKSIDTPRIEIIESEDSVLVFLYGRIDADSAPAIRERLLALIQIPNPVAVNIDLSAVTHIDSSGIATLIEALKISRGYEIELRLQGLHDRLLRLFESTGILALFNGSVPTNGQSGREVV